MFVRDASVMTVADWRQMATEIMEKKNCRWSEACLELKRRYPEARAAFGAPPAKES